MPQLTTIALKTTVAETIMSFLSSQSSYMFYGKHIPSADDTAADPVFDDVATAHTVYQNMVEGTKITADDITFMIPNIQWQSGTVYPCYTPTTASPIHVVVLVGVDYQVYKCIYNNGGVPSTATPSGTLTVPITSADGYVWKYMGTITQADRNKFETAKYVPFTANPAVTAAALPSALDRVDVLNGGAGWTNVFSGTFRAADITHGTTTFGLIETAPATAGFFVPCVIKITTPGSPIEGEYRLITGYTSGRLLTVNSAFSSLPQAGDTFVISPFVSVVSTNGSATNAFARAIVGPTGVITGVEVLDQGANLFNTAATALANNVVGVTVPAVLSPVVAPMKGHGGSPYAELAATTVGVSTTFDTTNVIKINDFRHYGVVVNPLYNRVVVQVTPGPGTAFADGDHVIVYRTKAQAKGTIVANAGAVTGTGTFFLDAVKSGDHVRVANNTVSVIATVASVANNTALTLSTDVSPPIAGTLELVDVAANGRVVEANTTHITVTNVSGKISPADKIYGTTTRTDMAAGANVSVGQRNSNPFDTFTQATTFIGSAIGPYVVDEVVNIGAGKASVHSANTTHLFVTNVSGDLSSGNAVGATSNTVFEPTLRLDGDLVHGSGEIVFVATTPPISRTVGNKQQIIIAIEFG